MTKQRKVAKPKFLFGHFQEFGDFCYPDKGHSLAMPRPAGRAAGEDCSPLLLHVRAIQNFMILACLTGRHRWPGLNQYVPLLESRVTHLSEKCHLLELTFIFMPITSPLYMYTCICTTCKFCICITMCVYMYLNCLTNWRGQI